MERLAELEGLVQSLSTQVANFQNALPNAVGRSLYTSTNDDGARVFSSGDTAWVMTSTALVLLMTMPGLAIFYAGMLRTKNVLASIMQTFTITCVITFLWVAFGYSLSFSPAQTKDSIAYRHNSIYVSYHHPIELFRLMIILLMI